MNESIYQFKIFYDNVNFYLPDSDDHIQKTIINTNSFYEFEMLKDIFESLLPNDVIIDVGANIGNHSLFLGKFCNPQQVYSFEPFPHSFNILKKNIEINHLENKITAIPYAVGSKPTRGNIILPDKSNLGMAKFIESQDGSIEVITLDEYFLNKLMRLDLIKIDVEGMELEVLKGARNLLKKFHPKIYIECAEKSELQSVSDYLSDLDYKMQGSFNATPTFSFVYQSPENAIANRKQISFFAGDLNHFHFLDPIIEYLVSNGYYAQKYLWESNDTKRMLSILQNSDLAWFDWGNGPIVAGSLLPKFCPIINRVHKYEIYQDEIKKINWKNVDQLIFVGDKFLNEFKKNIDANIEQKTNINIIPNPINSSIQFIERKKGKKIAYISRFHQDKNPLLMVDILEKLTRIDPEYKIYMIGRVQNVDLFNEVMRKIDEKRLKNNFIYEGIIDDVQTWLEDKSFLLSTATIESQGLGIMEAMMSGIKPIIYKGMELEIYPDKYLFNTIDEAVAMITNDDYNPREYRDFIEKNYSSDYILPKIKALVDETINRQKKSFDYEPFISICIPTYNRAEFLQRSISTILRQTYEKYEIIIIDDGSTDNTEDVIKSFNSPKIRYIRKEHSGIPRSRNRAIQEAKGEFILWVDSDDEVSAYLLERYVEEMNKYPDVDLFYCNLTTLDDITNEVGSRISQDWYNQENKAILHQIIYGIAFYFGGSLMRKKIFEEIGDFNIEFKRGQDYEMFSRLLLARKYKLKSINQLGYIWHFHNSNISGKMSTNVDKHYERESIREIFAAMRIDEIFYQLDWENHFTQSLVQALDMLTYQFIYYNSIRNTTNFLRLSNYFAPNQEKANKIALLEKELENLQNTINQIETNYDIITDENTKKQIEYLKHILEEQEINIDIPQLLGIENIAQENEAIINKQKTEKSVLFICDTILPLSDEYEIIINNIAPQLISKGYSIDIACNNDSDNINEINCFKFNANDNFDNKTAIKEIYRLAHLIENADYNAIIIISQLDNWIGRALDQVNSKKSNIIFIPSISKNSIENWKSYQTIPKVARRLSKADFIISFSQNGFDKKFFDENNLKHIFIPHSIQPIAIEFNFKEKYNLKHKHLILCVGNFYPEKNQSELIKTFLNEQGDWDLVIIGNKIKNQEEYFEMCNDLAKFDDRIKIIPGLPPEEVNQAIKESRVLLVPSLDGSVGPLVLLQAMYYKIPWIATPFCNAADEAGGIIAQLRDFPKYVKILFDNPSLIEDLGVLGNQHQQNSFSWDKSIGAFISLIEGKNEFPDLTMPADIRNMQSNLIEKIENIARSPHYQLEQYVFSVIIPTYNRADVLVMCLEALNNQTFPKDKFEVIVIDDGSTDDTEQKVRNFQNKYKLTYIKQNNSGPGPARNKGILQAKGEYSLILNDDAIMDPNNLEAHFNAHTKNKNNKVAIIGTFDYAPEFLKRPFVWFAQNSNVVFSYNMLEKNRPFNYRYFWTCNISIKTAALIEAGLFDENFSEPMMEDTEIGYRLQQLGYSVYFIPDAKSTHYHWLDVPGFVKRQEMNGRNVIKFISKYPNTLITEKAVFGLYSLDGPGIAQLRIRHQALAKESKNLVELFTSIDNKLEIPLDQHQIILPDQSMLDLKELKEQMTMGASTIREYHYLTGVLKQLEKQNYELTYHRKPISGPESILVKFVKNPQSEDTQENIELSASDIDEGDYLQILFNDANPKKVSAENLPSIQHVEKPIKILFTMYGWDESGGGTQLPRSIATALSKEGFDIAVFYAAGKHSSNNTSYYLEKRTSNNIKLYGVYNRPTIFLDEANPRREIRDDKILELFNYVLDQEQPNIIHFHNFLGLSFSIADAAEFRHIPTLFTPHNYQLIDPELYMFDMENNFRKWNGIDFFENSNLPKKYPDKNVDYKIRTQVAKNLLANSIDYVLAISQREADILSEFSTQNRNIFVVNQVSNICDELAKKNFAHHLHNPIRIGFIGSILIHKGIHIIYQAADLLKDEPVEFYLYGMGSPELIKALSNSFPNAKVKYNGGYSENDLFNIAKEIDAIIIPSIWEEGGPLTAPEAIAMQLPIIGANIGGIPDFVKDGINGLLYQFDNPANLANKIKDIIDNPHILEGFRDNLHLNITFQDYINHISSIYKNIINNKKMDKSEIELHFNNILNVNDSFIKTKQHGEIPMENKDESYHISSVYKPLMIHLGSQGVLLDGFENLDAQPQSDKEIPCDVRKLPYPSDSADMIMAIDLLQVFSHRETDAVLTEWARILKKGGAMILSVPDLKMILQEYYNGNLPITDVNQYLFGKQMNDYDYHYNSFDEISLHRHLQAAGLQVIEIQKEANSMPRLIARAIKI